MHCLTNFQKTTDNRKYRKSLQSSLDRYGSLLRSGTLGAVSWDLGYSVIGDTLPGLSRLHLGHEGAALSFIIEPVSRGIKAGACCRIEEAPGASATDPSPGLAILFGDRKEVG